MSQKEEHLLTRLNRLGSMGLLASAPTGMGASGRNLFGAGGL